MKSLILFLLMVYKNVLSPLLHQLLGQKIMCRYEVSCSVYAEQAIKKYGVMKGSMMGVSRLFRCQPFVGGTK